MWCVIVYVSVGLFLAHLLRSVFFKSSLSDVNYNTGFSLIYWWRWCWRYFEVWVERLLTKQRMNNYDTSGSSYYTCGLEATPSEQALEMPKPLLTDRHEDTMQIYGMDSEGRAIVARVTRRTQRRASLILVVVDTDGHMYTLPGQPDTSYINVTDSGWKAAGLMLQCVEPMRCWRLKFNGLLRKGAREEYITEPTDDTDEGCIVHARLDFLWHSLKSPVDVWKDSSPRLLARALANHPRNYFSSLFSSVDSMSLERDEYEQWGSLQGEVRLGGQPSDEPQTWYLRGCRRHRWGLSKDIANYHRSVEIFSYLSNGDVCSLQACSYGTQMSYYVLGYLQKSCDSYCPVTYTDLAFPTSAENGRLPQNLLVKFTAGGQNYDLWHKLGQGVTHHTGDPWTLTYKINFNSVAATHSHGWGISIFSDRFTDLCPVPERECLPRLEDPLLQVEEGTHIVVGISDYLCRATSLTGGKGASLAQLSMLKDISYYSFEVPNGVVVTVSGWQKQLRSSNVLQQAVRAIEKVLGSSSQQQLKDACAKAVETFKSAIICSEVDEALKNLIEEEFDGGFKGRRFAVRSSGCSEDGEESSAAGQNETLLGVEGVDNILKALAACWASQFTFQSVEYRRQRGQAVNGGMGVVIQEMVKADVAGVIFSQDPVTGSPSNITITANYGLGESVVSASADPDTIVVHRTWRDNLSVESTIRGAKETKFIVNENGGTSEVPVDEAERGEVCLSDTISLHLAQLALFLEKAYGSPRDIEFAVVKSVVYLLQARPVTGLESWTDFELIHEQDNGVLTDKELLTTANIGEVLPGAISPLTLSTIMPVLEIVFQWGIKTIEWFTFRFNPHHTRLVICVGRQMFLNMIEVQHRYLEAKQSATTDATDLAIHGYKVTTPEHREIALERFGVASKFILGMNFLSMIYEKLVAGRRIEKGRAKFEMFDIGHHRAESAERLYHEVTRRIPDLIQVSEDHLTVSKISSFTQMIAFIMLAEGNEELSEDNMVDIASLLSSCAGLESADVPSALKNVSRVIAENEEVNDFLGMAYEEAKVWLETHPGSVGREYRAFLEKHGHRCVKEIDMISHTWSMDPRPLIESLQTMVPSANTNRIAKEEISIQEAVDNLRTPIKDLTKRALKFVLPLCREAVNHREAGKYLLTKVIDGFRKAYLNLGHLMVGEGILPDADLVFFMKHQEIGALIKNRSPLLISKAVRRKRLQSQLDSLTYPAISLGVPKPTTRAESTPTINAEGSLALTGTPVCQGTITGTARVVTKLSEASAIQNGDILVTIRTDVGWTPYFPLLAGVITEIGGLISHGAVVAREYGLPCVVGVKGATELLSSGDTIILNASSGTITRIADKRHQLESST